MRLLSVLIIGAGLASGAVYAQSRGGHAPGRPVRPAAGAAKSIGKFEDWQAATHLEGGQTVCYAFTRVQASAPAVAGRGDVVLTVTQRPSGRDAVAMTAGFAYPANAEAVMSVDRAELPLYTSGRSAFARDGHAVTVAFERGAFEKARSAVVRSPGPRNLGVSDTFSLRGFGGAYAAINRACGVK